MIPFRYFSFWDVPRTILVKHKGHLFWLESSFDEEADEYSSEYSVYLLPLTVETEIIGSPGTVDTLKAEPVAKLPVTSLRFDRTRRKKLDAAALEQIAT